MTEKTGLFMLMGKRCDDFGGLNGRWRTDDTIILRAWPTDGPSRANRGSFSEEIISKMHCRSRGV